MKESILNGKKLLIVDDEPDILEVLEEEIHQACANCSVDKATNYEEAVKLLESNYYDLAILDIMGVNGFDLLESAVLRNLRVVMLTAHALNPEALKKSHDFGAMAYLPKDKLGEIVPFLEDALEHEYEPNWKRLLNKMEKYFEEQFKPNWKKDGGIS
jgi:DNA-binding response OmpR family regulator